MPDDGSLPAEVEEVGGWIVHAPALTAWVESAKSLVSRELAASPLAAGVPVKAVAEALRRTPDTSRRRSGETKRDASSKGKVQPTVPLPDGTSTAIRALLGAIISRAGLETADGMVRPPGHTSGLGAAEAGIAEIERRLAADPFAAPEAATCANSASERGSAVAEKAGRILRLGDGDHRSPAHSRAGDADPRRTRPALHDEPGEAGAGDDPTVVIPLLEHLDGGDGRADSTPHTAKSCAEDGHDAIGRPGPLTDRFLGKRVATSARFCDLYYDHLGMIVRADSGASVDGMGDN